MLLSFYSLDKRWKFISHNSLGPSILLPTESEPSFGSLGRWTFNEWGGCFSVNGTTGGAVGYAEQQVSLLSL